MAVVHVLYLIFVAETSNEPVFKRKLSEDQRPGSGLSDSLSNQLAIADAGSRRLSAVSIVDIIQILNSTIQVVLYSLLITK